MKKILSVPAAILLLLPAAGDAQADTIFTKDGIRIRGEIQEEAERYIQVDTAHRGLWRVSPFYDFGFACANTIYLEPKKGVICIPRHDVLRIEKESDATRAKARDAHHAGIDALGSGNADRAAAEFRKAIEIDPSFPDPYIELGDVIRFHEKAPMDAIEQFRKAIELEPDNFLAHFGLAYCHHDIGAYQKDEEVLGAAVAEYRRAQELNPCFMHVEMKLAAALAAEQGLTGMLYHMANVSYLNGDSASARENYGQVLEADPAHTGALAHLGMIAYRENDRKTAVDLLEKAVEGGDEDPMTHAYLGHALLYSEPRRLAEAVEAYHKALELASGRPLPTMHAILVLEGLAMAHGMSKEYEESEQRALEILEFKPDYVNAHYCLACTDAEQGRRKDACKDLENAFRWALANGTLEGVIATAENDSSMTELIKYSGFKKLVRTYRKKAEQR